MSVYTLWWEDDNCTDVYRRLADQIDGMLEAHMDVDVTVKQHVRAKTASQRGWFHYLCRLFGEEIGLTEGQVKDIAKAQIVGWRHVMVGGVDVVVPDGSSEDLGRLQYSELIEVLYRLAAESGVVLPDPDISRRVG